MTLLPDQAADVSYPREDRAISLYFKDPTNRCDREYHLQLVEVAPGRYNLLYQHGRRGCRLQEKHRYESPVPFRDALVEFESLVLEKRSQQHYQEVNLSSIGQIYAVMAKHGMNDVGVDLFMDRRGQIISLAEYANQAGKAVLREHSQILSYSAVCAARQAIHCLDRAGPGSSVSAAQLVRGLSQASSMLRTSGLEDMGIFVGYRDDAKQVYRGIPAQYHCSGLKP